MLKKIIIALTLVWATSASAQRGSDFVQLQKPVYCGSIEVIMKTMADSEVNEKPIWIGSDETEKSNYVLFVNDKTKAFTLVQFGQKTGCILGIGYKSDLHIPQTKM